MRDNECLGYARLLIEMKNNDFQECTECRCFVWCEFPKQVYHKVSGIPCDEFDKVEEKSNEQQN